MNKQHFASSQSFSLVARATIGLLGALLLAGCNRPVDQYPWLHDLDAEAGVKESGERLMLLSEGLHPLEVDANGVELIVAVHGRGSRGVEWVYPLQRLNDDQRQIWFFRWNDRGCPGPAAEQLRAAIAPHLSPEISRIRLLGHSYGGLVLAALLDGFELPVPVEIHIVASPLRGMGRLTRRCGYQPPVLARSGVSVFEWRTVQAQDGAFKNLAEDPQNVEIKGSKVTRLPPEYRGDRLGHNRSLRWVADELVDAR